MLLGFRFKAMGQASCFSMCAPAGQDLAVFKQSHKGTNRIGSQDTAKESQISTQTYENQGSSPPGFFF